jgi:UDP-GlcNAc:undecaprenyl-phosphate/decaprenyl-phosphate GlcNAc-1-phosphate transferase
VQALPSALALIAAFGLAPAALRALRAAGLRRENYRGVLLPFPLGFLIVPCGLIALVVCAPLEELGDVDVLRPGTAVVLLYGAGVALLGLIDDILPHGASVVSSAEDARRSLGQARNRPRTTAGGTAGPRGWRGHGRAVLAGAFSTGALKAAGSLGLAFFVLAGRYDQAGRYLLAVAVVVLATNLFNLIDLRPGRSTKAFVLLGAGLTVGTLDARPLAALGLLAFPAVALGLYDLREQAMLGDAGSNLLGALGGLWIVLSLGALGQLLALAVILLATVYGEFRSLGALIERTPVLRQLDSFGRPTHA